MGDGNSEADQLGLDYLRLRNRAMASRAEREEAKTKQEAGELWPVKKMADLVNDYLIMFQRDLRVIPTKFANRFGQLEERQRRAIVQWLNHELHDALTKFVGAAKALATKRTAVDDEIEEE
jgi:hypothetical protein